MDVQKSEEKVGSLSNKFIDWAHQNNQLKILQDAEKAIDYAKTLINALDDQDVIKDIATSVEAIVKKIEDFRFEKTCDLDQDEAESTPPVDTATTTPITPPPVTTPTPPAPVTPPTPVKPPVTTPPTTPPTNPTAPTVKYAPAVKPIKGNYNLYTVGLNWTNKKGPTAAQMAVLGNNVAKRYKELSDGQFIFNPIPSSVDVKFAYKAANLPAAEDAAKKIVTVNPPNKNPNLFIIVNSGVKGFSNASGGVAHLYGMLLRDSLHEVGHLKPFRLGHSGAYVDGVLKAYNDGTSFMSKFSSLNLTASQLYFLGWLPQKKVAQYDIGTPTIDYKIESLYAAKNTNDTVKAVLIPGTVSEQRPLYLSMPKVNNKNVFALHLSTGGGSQRVAVFDEKAEYNNVSFEKIAEDNKFSTVRVSSIAAKK